MLPDLYQAADKDIIDLLISVIDSPYSNYLTRQFVVAAVTKISSRHNTSPAQQSHFADILSKDTASLELESQQRAVEIASLFALGEVRVGVFQTAVLVSENKPVGSTEDQVICGFPFSLLTINT